MEENQAQTQTESPPILKKWSRLYWVVMINLISWLLIFYIFRKVFE